MGQVSAHLGRYRTFRADAYREENSAEIRVEAFFLAAFHYIEACAARQNVHIGKHQAVRRELEANDRIFGGRTAEVWKAFHDFERHVRPKFVYGARWTSKDFEHARSLFEKLEALCGEVLP